MTERAIGQHALLSSLAFAERAGIVICAVLFLLSKNRDFWTFWGLMFVVGHLMFLSPVYGILIYVTERAAYHARRRIGRPVLQPQQLKQLGRAVAVLWWPVMAFGSWQMFALFDRMVPAAGPVDFWRGLFT